MCLFLAVSVLCFAHGLVGFFEVFADQVFVSLVSGFGELLALRASLWV